MPVNVTIPLVDSSLGHSVIYEEYKGNFAYARRVAEEQLEKARRGNDASQFADAQLARGIVHLLQGEPASAQLCFAQIEHLVPSDPVRQFRALTFANLAAYLRFNTFPNGSGANGTEIQAHWGEFFTQVDEFSRRRLDLGGRVIDPAVMLEAELVYSPLSNIPVIRTLLDSIPFK